MSSTTWVLSIMVFYVNLKFMVYLVTTHPWWVCYVVTKDSNFVKKGSNFDSFFTCRYNLKSLSIYWGRWRPMWYHPLMNLCQWKPWPVGVLPTLLEGWVQGLESLVGSLVHMGMMSKASCLLVTWALMLWTLRGWGWRRDLQLRFALFSVFVYGIGLVRLFATDYWLVLKVCWRLM